MTAVFFEGSKKAVVEVALQPERLYFASKFPEHVDYCLVACDTKGIFNVVPVKVPLVRAEWAPVHEGDTMLIVQHPMTPNGQCVRDDNCSVGRFEEVLRRRDDLLFLKANGNLVCAGCPAFNDESELVGVHSQVPIDGEGVVSRILSIVTIVKHMFANGLCSKLLINPPMDAVWDTWYVTGDTTRIISIMANFKSIEILREAVHRLCEHTSKRDLLEGVVACGGTKVLVSSILQFKEDEELVTMALRSLWNISFTEEDNRQDIVAVNGVEAVLEIMEMYPSNEEIQQFGLVLLFNLTLTASTISDTWAAQAMRLALLAMTRFVDADVLQKFSVGFIVNLLQSLPKYCALLAEHGGVTHVVKLTNDKRKNVLLMEGCMQLFSVVSAAEPKNPAMRPLVVPTIELMTSLHTSNVVMLHGNNTLWNLGADVENRISILQHPQGTTVLAASINPLMGERPIIH